MLHGKYPLLIALVLGLFAGVLAYSAIKAREKAVREGWQTRRILCAAVDVAAGSELEDEMLRECEIPEKFVTSSFITTDDDESAAAAALGQRVLVPLNEGDPILFSHFESQREYLLSESIPAKARAVAVEVNERSAVARWIKPNDHVDVIGNFADPQTQEKVSVTLLQNIIVLATGKISGHTTYVEEGQAEYNQVVLLVLPEEAEMIALAQEQGTLTLALRNPKDLNIDEVRTKKTDSSTLLTGERSALLQQTRAKVVPQTIDIIRGNARTREALSGGDAAQQ